MMTDLAAEAKRSFPVRLAFAVLDDLLAGVEEPGATTPNVAALLAALDAPDQALLDGFLARQAGSFVSLHLDDQLRGCIGTIDPVCANLFEEICQNTVSAATFDPRFPAVSAYERPHLSCSVDVLGTPEPLPDRSQWPALLDAERYGVIVTLGRRTGVLLPDLNGVDSPDAQISIALSKAGIAPHQPFDLERFEVVRYE